MLFRSGGRPGMPSWNAPFSVVMTIESPVRWPDGPADHLRTRGFLRVGGHGGVVVPALSGPRLLVLFAFVVRHTQRVGEFASVLETILGLLRESLAGDGVEGARNGEI